MTETVDLIGSVEDALPLARRIAAKWAESYPPVEYDDLYQELSLWLVENAARVVGKSAGYAYTSLKRRATAYARQEKAAREHRDAQHYYWKYDVRQALAELNAELTTIPRVVVRADLAMAWEQLTERQREVLLAWADASADVVYESVADDLGLASADSARKLVSRARLALQRHMNGQGRDHEGPGSRKAMSNEKARWLTGGNYENAYTNGGAEHDV